MRRAWRAWTAAWALFLALTLVQANARDIQVDETGPGLGEDAATPITALQRELRAGEAPLENEPGQGCLRSLLRALRISVTSQVLVFSKTSLQRELISPQTPRAIYFNDDVYVAWVPGSDSIELSDIHPTQGSRFYTLHQAATPTFTTRHDCVRCHDGLKTFGVPGFLMGSNFTAPDGQPWFAADGYRGGHRSPLLVRWGGWYVTGTHSGDVHLGNTFLTEDKKAQPESLDATAGANLTDLRGRFDTTKYLSPHSDIVALLVLEHQVRMHNLISRLHREWQNAQAEFSSQLGQRPGGVRNDAGAAGECIAPGAEALLEYMLFRDEAPLQGPVQGTSDFTREFERQGPWDSKGRSLRQLDLQHRLLRFPCSYLIYSAAFDAFHSEVKDYLWRRLAEILSGQDRSPTYASMPAEDRGAVLEILEESKPEFAAWLRLNAPSVFTISSSNIPP